VLGLWLGVGVLLLPAPPLPGLTVLLPPELLPPHPASATAPTAMITAARADR
jgi:hypothetical protein